MPARLSDNPFVNQAQYAETLSHLPNAERERLLHGDWEIPDDGELFQRPWVPIVPGPDSAVKLVAAVRYWDLAATEPSPANSDPDYTVGLRLDLDATGTYFITDIVRARKPAGSIEQLVAATAERDGRSVRITIEQEPGAAGSALAERYKRQILRGYTVKAVRPTGTKETRATPVAAAAENGLIKLVNGRHAREFLDEITAFPHAPHDDCVDALAGAFEELSRRSRSQMRVAVPRGRMDFSHTTEYQYGYGAYQHSPYPYAPSTLPPREPVRHLNGAGYPDHPGRPTNKNPR